MCSMILAFDLIKFIMSFFIASVHIHTFASFSENFDFWFSNTICRMAVPIFFAISGYLLIKKLKNATTEEYKLVVKKYLKRLLIIYIIWTIIYLPIYFSYGLSLSRLLKLIPRFLVHGVHGQLWFFPALLLSSCLVIIMYRKIGIKKTFLISLLLYLIGLAIIPYSNLTSQIIAKIPFFSKLIIYITKDYGDYRIVRSGLFFGMIFFSLGGLLNYYTIDNKKMNIIGLFISIILLCLETYIIKVNNGIYYGLQLMLLLTTFFTMNILLNTKNECFSPKIRFSYLRNLSILIFLIHEFVHFLFLKLVNIINVSILNNSLIAYLIIMFITILLANIIIKLSQTSRFKSLKEVY